MPSAKLAGLRHGVVPRWDGRAVERGGRAQQGPAPAEENYSVTTHRRNCHGSRRDRQEQHDRQEQRAARLFSALTRPDVERTPSPTREELAGGGGPFKTSGSLLVATSGSRHPRRQSPSLFTGCLTFAYHHHSPPPVTDITSPTTIGQPGAASERPTGASERRSLRPAPAPCRTPSTRGQRRRRSLRAAPQTC